MSSLTPKQKQVLDYLAEFIHEHGHSPTLQRISERFGLRSLSTVHKHLTALRDKGLIEWKYNTRHGISLKSATRDGQSRLVPITGGVAPDGTLCENTSEPSAIDVPAALAPGERSFALRITGSPLPGSGLADGDFIIAHETDGADGHELLIAEVGGRTRLTTAETATGRSSTAKEENRPPCAPSSPGCSGRSGRHGPEQEKRSPQTRMTRRPPPDQTVRAAPLRP